MKPAQGSPVSSFDSQARMFHFERTEFPDVTTRAGDLLLDILDQSKRGDFSSAPKLVEVFAEAPSLHTTLGVLSLVPFVTLREDLFRMVGPLSAVARSREELEWLCSALVETGLLDAADLAVDLYLECNVSADQRGLPEGLSRMLDADTGELFYGPSETLDLRGYAAFAHERIASARSVNPDASFYRGEPINVARMVSNVLRALRSPTPWHGEFAFNDARARIEAFTGFDLSECWHEHFDPTIAKARMKELASVVELQSFVPGQRYFFGHKL